jgi:hypothetical protein
VAASGSRGARIGASGLRGALALELGLLALALLGAHILYVVLFHSHEPTGDVLEYQRYAMAFLLHHPRFHQLPVEYPPLAIVPFILTVIPPLHDPEPVFAFWMGLLVLAGYLWLRLNSTRARAITYAAYLLVGTAGTVLARYDLVPALATLLALWAVQRRQFARAYIMLAIGVLLKLYPAFLVPLVAVEQWRVLRAAAVSGALSPAAPALPPAARALARRATAWLPVSLRRQWERLAAAWARWPELQVAGGLGICAGVVAVAFAVALLLSPHGALSGFTYASARPLQIESAPATLLWLGTLLGSHAHAIFTYHSLNFVGPLDAELEPLSLWAMVLGCLLVYWRQLRGRLDVGQAFVATLCVVIVTNKVFSPQYLIWVLPLVAYVAGFDALWLAIGALTTFIFPVLYFSHPRILAVPLDWRFLPAVAVRNALLLLATIRAALGAPHAPAALADARRLATAERSDASSAHVSAGIARP